MGWAAIDNVFVSVNVARPDLLRASVDISRSSVQAVSAA